MLRRSLILAVVIGAALLLCGCQAGTLSAGHATLLKRQGPGGHAAKTATWTFTAPGSWELRWSFSDCPVGLGWFDDLGATANPVSALDRGGQLDVFVELPTIIQYRAGRSGSGVQRFDQGGSVRLRVAGRCRWQVAAVTV